jgi:hypothetical protein
MSAPQVLGLQWTAPAPVSEQTIEPVSFQHFLCVQTIPLALDLSEFDSEDSFVQTAGFAAEFSPLPMDGVFEPLHDSPDSTDFHLSPVWLPALFQLTRRYAVLRRGRPRRVEPVEFSAPPRDMLLYAKGPGFSGVLAFPSHGDVCSDVPARSRPARKPAPRNSPSGSSPWQNVLGLWRGLPPFARGITLALPLIAPAMFFAPPISFPASASNHAELSAAIQARATVDLQEDFQTGLSAWTRQKGWESSWSIVSPGSAQPGRLALYRPTLPLTDYRLQLRGDIQAKGLGFVFRATDLNNYYAVKLAIRNVGPMPSVYLVRYAVIGGRAGQKTETLLPMYLQSDSLYDVMITVRGADFTATVNGQLVDTWSDDRLKLGGIGLFAEKGEIAHLRSIHVMENEDFLGWICSQVSRWNADRNAIGVKHE